MIILFYLKFSRVYQRDQKKGELRNYIYDVNRKLAKVRTTNVANIIRKKGDYSLVELSRHLGVLFHEFGTLQQEIKHHERKSLQWKKSESYTEESLRFEI